MRKVILAVLISIFSASGFASVGMPSYQIPENVGIYPDGKLEIIFPDVFNSGCTIGDGKRMFVQVGNSQGVTDETFKIITSIVLSAMAAQKPIKFWYDRIGTTCEGGKVNIMH